MSTIRGEGSTPSDTARFLVLEVPVGTSVKRKVLGTVIPRVNTSNPFEVFSPWAPRLSEVELKEIQDIENKLWQDEEATVTLKDTSFDRTRQQQTGAEAQLSDLFKASLSKSKGQEVHIKAGTAKRYSIISPGNAVPEWLFSSTTWMNQLQHMYSNKMPDEVYPKKDLALVTGIFTCQGLEVSWKRESGNGASVDMKILPGSLAQQAVGDPGIAAKLDVLLKVNHQKSNAAEVIATCEQEIIFALAYHELLPVFEEREKPVRSWASFGLKRIGREPTDKIIRCVLGKPIRGGGYDAYTGEDKAETEPEFYYKEPDFSPLHRRTNTIMSTSTTDDAITPMK